MFLRLFLTLMTAAVLESLKADATIGQQLQIDFITRPKTVKVRTLNTATSTLQHNSHRLGSESAEKVTPEQPLVPPDLENLACLDKVVVLQCVELMEALLGIETENRYKIMNSRGEEIYYAYETSGCMQRYFCGHRRGFVIHIVNHFGKIGYLKQRCSCCSSSFYVNSADDRPLMCVIGPFWCCTCGCQRLCCGCCDIDFKIKSTDGSKVGKITRRWSGCCRQKFTDADKFILTFPIDLEVNVKALLLGSVFLVDFMEFETNAFDRKGKKS